MPAAADAPSRSPGRSFLRRLLSAQESGLVLVIVLMMTALTVFGGTKPRMTTEPIPAGAEVVLFGDDGVPHPAGSLPDRLIRRIEVTPLSGATRVFEGSVGFRQTGDDRSVVVSREANKFLELGNLIRLANNASFIAVMAVAMTAVIITAGIDLSVGSIYALAAVVAMMVVGKLPPGTQAVPAAMVLIAAACSAGAVMGAVNGAMIVGFRLHPFIITLGGMSVFRGIGLLVTQGGQTISGMPESAQTGFFKQDFGLGAVHPMNSIIMLLVALAGWFVLRYTVFGRRVYAVGSNETAAHYAGVPVGRVKVWVYTLMGAAAGLAGAMAAGYYGAATPNMGVAYELRVIAATVIGGASLTGGRGTALGAVLGAIVIELINNAITILGIDNNYLLVVTGAAIVIAAVIDRIKQGLQAR